MVGIQMGYVGHEGKVYYVFMTKEKPDGPLPLWISYTIERERHRVRIFDIRQHPDDKRRAKKK